MEQIIHNGFYRRRIKNNPREKAFAEEWEKECKRDACIGYGLGLLQDLFMHVPRQYWGSSRFHAKPLMIINQRDALIVATVIQWLGSNVGMSFLHNALKKCGYRIEKTGL